MVDENVKVCLMYDLDYLKHFDLEMIKGRGSAICGPSYSFAQPCCLAHLVCMDKAARVGVLSSFFIILKTRSSCVPVFMDCTFELLLLEWSISHVCRANTLQVNTYHPPRN